MFRPLETSYQSETFFRNLENFSFLKCFKRPVFESNCSKHILSGFEK